MIYAPAKPTEADIPPDVFATAASIKPGPRVVIGTLRRAGARRAVWAVRFQRGQKPAVEELADGSTFTPVGGWRS